MNSKWNNVLTSTTRSPRETKQTRKRIVPDRVYNIGNAIQIILHASAQLNQVTLQCREKKPIRFTYEEFTKFIDFVYNFMNVEDFIYGFMDCAVPKCFDFVVGKYKFLSCWNNENTCGLAIKDTKNNDFVAWNENDIEMFISHKYQLYEFLKSNK